MSTPDTPTPKWGAGWVLSLLAALLGFAASVQLTLEKIRVWTVADYTPSCSINPLFSCSGPLQSWQSEVFGLPNPVYGMVGYGILIAFLLLSKTTTFPRRVWGAYLLGNTAALGFLMWLASQAIYDIQALCIYCIAAWIASIALTYAALHRFAAVALPAARRGVVQKAAILLAVLHPLLLSGLILIQFRSFFGFYLGV